MATRRGLGLPLSVDCPRHESLQRWMAAAARGGRGVRIMGEEGRGPELWSGSRAELEEGDCCWVVWMMMGIGVLARNQHEVLYGTRCVGRQAV